MNKLRWVFIGIVIIPSFLSAQTWFSEVGLEKGLNYIYPGNDNQEVGAGVTVLDVNKDGWDDFFQSGGVFESKLWINHKGFFVDETDRYLGNLLKGYFIQSTVAGDFDQDGWTDLFICNFGDGMRMGDKKHPLLLKNQSGRSFFSVFQDDFSILGHFSSAAWGDVNQDGYLDLYLTNYVKIMRKPSNNKGKEIGYDPDCLPNYFI